MNFFCNYLQISGQHLKRFLNAINLGKVFMIFDLLSHIRSLIDQLFEDSFDSFVKRFLNS